MHSYSKLLDCLTFYNYHDQETIQTFKTFFIDRNLYAEDSENKVRVKFALMRYLRYIALHSPDHDCSVVIKYLLQNCS